MASDVDRTYHDNSVRAGDLPYKTQSAPVCFQAKTGLQLEVLEAFRNGLIEQPSHLLVGYSISAGCYS